MLPAPARAPSPATTVFPRADLVVGLHASGGLSDLFNAFGRPPALDALADAARLAVARALFGASVSTPLARALATVASLASDAGRAALFEAARDVRLGTEAWPHARGPAALAAWVVARAAEDDALAGVAERALLRARRLFDGERAQERMGRRAGPMPRFPAALEDLERALRAALVESGRGDFVAVHGHRDPDTGVVHLQVVHGGRVQSILALNGEAIAPVDYVPLRADLIRYEAASGRLAVTTATPSLVPVHARVLGDVTWDDPAFFGEEATVTLVPLQEEGEAALTIPDGLKRTVARARVIELAWDSGVRDLQVLQGEDALKAALANGVPLLEGEISRVTIRLDLTPHGAAEHGVGYADLALEIPNRFTCSEPAVLGVCRVLAETAGFTRPADVPAKDLFRIGRGAHPADTFRALVRGAGAGANEDGDGDGDGDASVAAWVAKGILVPRASRALVPPECPGAGRALVAFPLTTAPGKHYGVGTDPFLSARTLGEADLEALVLDPVAFGRHIAEDLRLDGNAEALAGTDGGVVGIGSLRLPSVELRFFVVMRRPGGAEAAVGLGERLRRVAAPGHAVALMPPGRGAVKLGVTQVGLPSVAGPYRMLLGEVSAELNVEGELTPDRWMPPGVRVLVRAATQEVFVDGVRVIAPPTVCRMFERLARSPGEFVLPRDLGIAISRARGDDKTVRDTRTQARKAIESSFAAVGKKAPTLDSLVEQRGRRGSRLIVEANVS